MYVYAYKAILATAMNNISDKEMTQAFTELTVYLKIRGIKPGFHFMDNEASIALKWKFQPWTSSTNWFPQVITGKTMHIETSIRSKTIS